MSAMKQFNQDVDRLEVMIQDLISDRDFWKSMYYQLSAAVKRYTDESDNTVTGEVENYRQRQDA